MLLSFVENIKILSTFIKETKMTIYVMEDLRSHTNIKS